MEYRCWGTVSLRTDRDENVIHGEAKTENGDPATKIGNVTADANGSQVDSDDPC